MDDNCGRMSPTTYFFTDYALYTYPSTPQLNMELWFISSDYFSPCWERYRLLRFWKLSQKGRPVSPLSTQFDLSSMGLVRQLIKNRIPPVQRSSSFYVVRIATFPGILSIRSRWWFVVRDFEKCFSKLRMTCLYFHLTGQTTRTAQGSNCSNCNLIDSSRLAFVSLCSIA